MHVEKYFCRFALHRCHIVFVSFGVPLALGIGKHTPVSAFSVKRLRRRDTTTFTQYPLAGQSQRVATNRLLSLELNALIRRRGSTNNVSTRLLQRPERLPADSTKARLRLVHETGAWRSSKMETAGIHNAAFDRFSWFLDVGTV